jgi:hypothetical protein
LWLSVCLELDRAVVFLAAADLAHLPFAAAEQAELG